MSCEACCILDPLTAGEDTDQMHIGTYVSPASSLRFRTASVDPRLRTLAGLLVLPPLQPLPPSSQLSPR